MPSSADDIAHLLRRSGFVATQARIDELTPLDLASAVDRVLDTSANPDDTPPASVMVRASDTWRQIVTAGNWWLDRMVNTPTPIVEKMTLFWHGHFTSAYEKTNQPPELVAQNRLYRANALGDFRTLCQSMAVTGAMLRYLDNADNVAGEPNQNFARELMELFMLGVGNYTEADVDAAARAWTGHNTVSWDDPRYVFKPENHDNGDKTFFGVTRNWDGPEIIDEILTNPTKRPIVARFIARKLWEFFAYQRPADSIVSALADAFMASNLSIRELLRALFTRPEFYSTQAKQGLVRTPVEYVVATLKGLGMSADPAHPEWFAEPMGQMLFNPPNVAGWKQNAYWVNSSAFTGRAEFARNLTWALYQFGFWSDVQQMSVDAAIDRAAQTFSIHPLSSTTRAALVNWLNAQRSVPYRGWAEGPNLLTMILLTPEMHVA